jgi:chromatin segregation and condensation protein Rec8/ScpA/Scc1 (kleisin family)
MAELATESSLLRALTALVERLQTNGSATASDEEIEKAVEAILEEYRAQRREQQMDEACAEALEELDRFVPKNDFERAWYDARKAAIAHRRLLLSHEELEEARAEGRTEPPERHR